MPTQAGIENNLQPIITADQIARRIREMARQIQHDYHGRRLHLIAVLDNSYVFLADLMRALDLPVLCDFIRPSAKHAPHSTEIFFAPEPDVRGADVILLRGVVHSGVTTEFLARTLLAQGAASVKVATLLDRPSGHRISIQPDYFGFVISENYVCGCGIPGPGGLGRNLPYIAAVPDTTTPGAP